MKDAYLEIYSKKLGFLGGLCKIFSKGNIEKKVNETYQKMIIWEQNAFVKS